MYSLSQIFQIDAIPRNDPNRVVDRNIFVVSNGQGGFGDKKYNSFQGHTRRFSMAGE